MNKKILVIAAIIVAAGALSAFGYVLELTNGGTPLAWTLNVSTTHVDGATHQVIYHLNCTTNVAPADQANCATWFTDSFLSWTNVTTSKVDFEAGAPSTQTTTGSDSINLMTFVMDDPELTGGVIALTTTYYDSTTGEITDSDIRFNASDFDFFNLAASNYEDLQAVATHEIGHVFGLDHSFVGYVGADLDINVVATMFPIAETSSMKNLKQDDESGASVIYPEASFSTVDGAVSGKVTDTTGGGVLGSHVVLLQLADGVPLVAALTDSSGNYTIQGVPPGIYVAMCEHPLNASYLGPYYAHSPTGYKPVLYNNRQLTSYTDAAPPSAVFAAAAANDPVTAEAGIDTPSINCAVAYTPTPPTPPPTPPAAPTTSSNKHHSGCSMSAARNDTDFIWLLLVLAPILAPRLARKRLRHKPGI